MARNIILGNAAGNKSFIRCRRVPFKTTGMAMRLNHAIGNSVNHFSVKVCMFPAIVVPDMPVPAFDTRPIAALVYEQPADGVAARLKAIAQKAETTVTPHRRLVKATMYAQLSNLSQAEVSGWYINAAPLRDSLRERRDEDSKSIADLMVSIDVLVRDMHRARVPGANTLHESARKIRVCLNAWLDDLEDYLTELNETEQRMSAKSHTAPMMRAAGAYSNAIEAVVGVKSKPEVLMDLTQGEPLMSFSVPLADELRFDRVSRRALERRIHDHVKQVDEDLVGRVAIRYETPLSI